MGEYTLWQQNTIYFTNFLGKQNTIFWWLKHNGFAILDGSNHQFWWTKSGLSSIFFDVGPLDQINVFFLVPIDLDGEIIMISLSTAPSQRIPLELVVYRRKVRLDSSGAVMAPRKKWRWRNRWLLEGINRLGDFCLNIFSHGVSEWFFLPARCGFPSSQNRPQRLDIAKHQFVHYSLVRRCTRATIFRSIPFFWPGVSQNCAKTPKKKVCLNKEHDTYPFDSPSVGEARWRGSIFSWWRMYTASQKFNLLNEIMW